VPGGLPRKIGRTVSALRATLDDLRLALSPAALAESGGGLRGGSWEIRGDRLVLERYEAVSGVTLTGSGTERLTLRVGGSEAAHGTVTLRPGGRLSGTLGGRRVSKEAPTIDYAPGTIELVTQHDGSVLKLRKLADDYDPTDRIAAIGRLAEHQAHGEVVTGLLYIDPEADDLHDYLGTVKTPLNQLGDAELTPGPKALAEINASLR